MSFTDYIRVNQSFRTKHQPIHDGLVVHLDADGNIERTSHKSLHFEGSFSTSVQYRSDGHLVQTSGNHGRYGRPDNVSNYTLDEWKFILNNINHELKLPPFTGDETYLTEKRNKHGEPTYTRQNDGASITEIHQTDNFFAGSQQNAIDFIHAMSMVNINRQQVVAYKTGATWGQGSRFKSAKLYSKSDDMIRLLNKGKLADLPYIHNLIEYCTENGLIRYEVQFRKYLARHSCTFWNEATQNNIDNHFQQELQLMSKTKSLTDLTAIPLATLGIYFRYTEGENVRRLLKKSAFYKHRSILLEYGIDIKETLNVKKLPLQQKIITLIPAIMPDWYYLPDVKPNQKVRLLGDFDQINLTGT